MSDGETNEVARTIIVIAVILVVVGLVVYMAPMPSIFETILIILTVVGVLILAARGIFGVRLW